MVNIIEARSVNNNVENRHTHTDIQVFYKLINMLEGKVQTARNFPQYSQFRIARVDCYDCARLFHNLSCLY